MSGKDPFADFGLPEDVPQAEDKPKPESSQAAPRPGATSAVQWQASVFEVQPLKGAKDCATCAFFVPGGKLAVDQIYELKSCDGLIDFSLEASESGWEFERRELEEIIEKAKTLDDRYDQQPRVKSYCAAELARGRRTYLIPEIKNRDRHCADHQLGSRPWVNCSDCSHFTRARVTEPSRADYRVDLDDYSSLRDPDFNFDVGVLRGAYDRADRQYEARTREYESRLKADASSVAYGEGDVENGTIDECSKFYKACAVINRTNHCPSFEGKFTNKSNSLLVNTIFGNLLVSPGQLAPPSDSDRAAHQRAENAYAEALQRRREAESSAQPRPPCFDCAHKREPVDADPFREIHKSGKEIMDLRNQCRQARSQQVLEERRISSGPGDGLGDVEPPVQHLWCDKHSRRSTQGKILEYAYCYRVLKALAPTGNCPSFVAQDSQEATGAAVPATTTTTALMGSWTLPKSEPQAKPVAQETQEERWRRFAIAEHEAKRQRKERGRLRKPRPG